MTKATIEDFYTRDAANAGIKVPLHLPSGEESEHYLMVLGVDSDAFRRAELASKRKVSNIIQLPESEKEDAIYDSEIALIASLVDSWSFEDECTPENVENFLKSAPQIKNSIDKFAGNRALFIGNKSNNLPNTPEPSSCSTKNRKAQNVHSEKRLSKSKERRVKSQSN